MKPDDDMAWLSEEGPRLPSVRRATATETGAAGEPPVKPLAPQQPPRPPFGGDDCSPLPWVTLVPLLSPAEQARVVAARRRALSNLPAGALEALSDEQHQGVVLFAEWLASLELRTRTTQAVAHVAVTGGAGTGKTTVMRVLAAIGRAFHLTVLYMAPTGKAASRIRQVLELPAGEATTIHGPLYGEAEEEGRDGQLKFGEPRVFVDAPTLVLVDEGSMLAPDLWQDLRKVLRSQDRIAVIADPYQLPPVITSDGGPRRPGPPPEPINLARPLFHLSQIHRQADGGIIRLSTAIREGRRPLPSDEDIAPQVRRYRDTDLHQAANWLARRRERDIDATLLCWTNEVRQNLNERVRALRGLDEQPLTPGDRLLVKANNRTARVFNGEVFPVTEAGPLDDYGNWQVQLQGVGRIVRALSSGTIFLPLAVNIDLIGQKGRAVSDFFTRMPVFSYRWLDDAREAYTEHMRNSEGSRYTLGESEFRRWVRGVWLTADYGEALTVHASQGSQWDHVGFIADGKTRWFMRAKPDESRPLAYTAYTRAISTLAIFYTP